MLRAQLLEQQLEALRCFGLSKRCVIAGIGGKEFVKLVRLNQRHRCCVVFIWVISVDAHENTFFARLNVCETQERHFDAASNG